MQCVQNNLLKLIPEWLSALGTLLAVIVALYLAYRDKLIQCIATATFDRLFKEAKNNPSMVSITVTNIGVRSFTISKIGWQSGIFKKKFFSIIPPPNPESAKLPLTLTDSKPVEWYIPLTACPKIIIPKIFMRRLKHLLSFSSYFIRFKIRTTTGKSFTFKIHKDLRREIIAVSAN